MLRGQLGQDLTRHIRAGLRHDCFDVFGTSFIEPKHAPGEEVVVEVVVVAVVEAVAFGDSAHGRPPVRRQDARPREFRADGLIQGNRFELGLEVRERDAEDLFGPKRHAAVHDPLATRHDEIVVHVPEEHVVAQETIPAFDRERDAGTAGLAHEIETFDARGMLRHFETHLRMERDADLSFPFLREFAEPWNLEAEHIVLEVDQLERPTFFFDSAGLANQVVDVACRELEPVVHRVEHRGVAVGALVGATDRTEHALNRATPELRACPIEKAAVWEREGLFPSLEAEVHTVRKLALEDGLKEAESARAYRPVGVLGALVVEVGRVRAADDDLHAELPEPIAGAEGLEVVAGPDLEAHDIGLPFFDRLHQGLVVVASDQDDPAIPAVITDSAEKMEDTEGLNGRILSHKDEALLGHLMTLSFCVMVSPVEEQVWTSYTLYCVLLQPKNLLLFQFCYHK